MKKKKTAKILENKIFLIVISLLTSLIMWSYIANPDSTDYRQTFQGVQVEFQGQEKILANRNLSITNVDTQSVTVTLKGNRSKISKLTSNDLRAVIDVSSIKQAREMTWAYVIEFPANFDSSDVEVINRSPDSISFTVVQNATKTISVKGSFEGEIDEDCIAEAFLFEPSTIVVEGPEEKIEQIDYAWVTFGKDKTESGSGKVVTTYSEEVGFLLIDKNGQSVSTKGLKLSANVITATQPILEIKEIPLKVNLIPGGGVTEQDCTVSIEPTTIKIAGDSAIVEDLNSIDLGNVDLAEFESGMTATFPITISDGLQNLTGITEATVKIEIKGIHTKTVTTRKIETKNVTAGYSAEIETKAVEVTVRSKSEADLREIKPEDVSVIVDLDDYGTTTGRVSASGTAKIDGPSTVGAVGDIRVSVILKKN